MIPSIVSSLIYINARKLGNHFPPELRNAWKDWELRVLVLLSLTLQTILIILGNRRKYTRKIWIRIVLWCAYLSADWVATVALGVISNNLGDVMESIGKDGSLSESIQLTAFWAPFLLLHLGGPDTITAYSLEDNELWLRHLLGLGVQTGVALYIFVIAWTASHLSILSILIFCAGIIKYGERTWVLRSASNEQLRESMLIPPKPDPNYSKFMREYTLKKFEGFHVKASHVIEAQVVHIPEVENEFIPDATELVKADDLFQNFKRLFVDLILSSNDRVKSQYFFKEISLDEAFKVIEMELGLMYDMLYTKAKIIHSFQGRILRLISFSLTSITLVFFSFIDMHKYSNADLVITFLLLSVAILLEIYAFLLLLSSDRTDIWLSRHATTSILQAIIHKAITCLQLPKKPRWSKSISQFNLLSFSLKDKHTVFYGILKCLHIDKFLEKTWYTTHEDVGKDLKPLIFSHLQESIKHHKEESDDATDIRTLCSHRGGEALKKCNSSELDWSVKVEFDQSILIWHLATDICYQLDQEYRNSFMELSMLVSQNMLYLLVICPFMLPMGIGMIRFQDTCNEITHFFEAHKSIEDNSDIGKSYACKKLFEMIPQVPPSEVERERSKSVLFDACSLASKLQAISDKEQKWKMISNVWVEMLAYAACHCRGNHHAQQLRRGGELLTHVWLLMAHFGINEQFQTSQGHARAKLVAK
ncbi:hypothetical protein CMV_023070 [Castanea mollissima]|uniref:DUF4220 domain-containing protein n=1 Tax=Castanea mollissima TaxID=60419 RepID=A0A8J4QR02_9ROSI|nr:hypothetical protein CMV_023070 [Castanea mollissima]